MDFLQIESIPLRTSTPAEPVGARLRRLRIACGLSQRDLSAPGITAAYVSKIERGERRPSVRALRVMAGKLGVSLPYLETGVELGDGEARELRLADAELRMRLQEGHSTDELDSILAEAVAAADSGAIIRARVALGMAAAARGDYVGAALQLKEVVTSERVTPVSRPDVYAALGECYALSGEPGRAADVYRGALAHVEATAPEDHATRIRFATYLSYALTDDGQLERANEVVEAALRLADAAAGASDPYTRVRLHWSLGRIAHEQSRFADALHHFRGAVALLEATEDTFHLARAYQSCAAAMLALGNADLSATVRLIDKAEHIFGTSLTPRDHATLHRLKAMVAIRRGEYMVAAEHARQAQVLARDIPNQYGLATWVLADALAGEGDDEAEAAYAEATRVLRVQGSPRERLELFRVHARYLRANANSDEAFALLEEAAELASEIRRADGTHATEEAQGVR